MTCPVKIVKDTETFHRVQFLTPGVQMVQFRGNIGTHAVKESSRFLHRFFVNRKRNITFLNNAVGGIRNLSHEHFIVFLPETVQFVPFHG